MVVHGAVEGGVETGDLRHSGGQRCTATNGRHAVGLVQRRERRQHGQSLQHRAIDHDRIDECGAAMHHTMADGDEATLTAAQGLLREQLLEQGFVHQLGAVVAEGLLDQRAAGRRPCDKPWRDPNLLDFSAEHLLQVRVWRDVPEGELQAR